MPDLVTLVLVLLKFSKERLKGYIRGEGNSHIKNDGCARRTFWDLKKRFWYLFGC